MSDPFEFLKKEADPIASYSDQLTASIESVNEIVVAIAAALMAFPEVTVVVTRGAMPTDASDALVDLAICAFPSGAINLVHALATLPQNGEITLYTGEDGAIKVSIRDR